MLNKDFMAWIGDWIRPATVGAGVVAYVVLALLYLIDGSSDDANSIDTMAFNVLVFGLPLAWFASNGLRWLQERLLPPGGSLVFAAIALSACIVGGGAIIFAVASLNDQSNLADNEGVSNEVFAVALGATAIVFGVIAALSALMVYSRDADPATVRINGLVRRVMDTPSYRGASDRLAHLSRWLAIAGGALFAIAFFASPAAIAPAIALTCLVRYVTTLDASEGQRLGVAAAVAILLISIPVGYLLAFDETESAVLVLGLASASVMIAALALGVLNRGAGSTAARVDAVGTNLASDASPGT